MNSPSETRPESILGKRARDGSSTVTVTPINKKSKQGAASVSYPTPESTQVSSTDSSSEESSLSSLKLPHTPQRKDAISEGLIANPQFRSGTAHASRTRFLQDINNYIPLGSLTLRPSIAEKAYLPERDWIEISPEVDSSLWLAFHGCLTAEGGKPALSARKLSESGLARIFTRKHQVQHEFLTIRVYVLPEDVGRRYIERHAGKGTSILRSCLEHLIHELDISSESWEGYNHQFDQSRHYDVDLKDEDSLFYLFNTLPSPRPGATLVSCSASNDAMQSVMTSTPLSGLHTHLYPYQRRTVAKMIQREVEPEMTLDPRFQELKGPAGRHFFYDDVAGVLIRDGNRYEEVRGGILGESMGLGKTLICLATIIATQGHWPEIPPEHSTSLHPVRPKTGSLMQMAAAATGRARVPWRVLFQDAVRAGQDHKNLTAMLEDNAISYTIPPPPAKYSRRSSIVREGKRIYLSTATLIIAPQNLLNQWRTEISTHVMTDRLQVLYLDSVGEVPLPLADRLRQFDVILMSRSRFEKEMVPGESGRPSSKARKARGGCLCSLDEDCHCSTSNNIQTPLKDIHWLRIIMDEGHEFSSSGRSGTVYWALQDLLVDRKWIVSGTPANGLLGVEVGTAIQEIRENSADDNCKSARAMLEARRKESALSQERKDLEKLGILVTGFLQVKPWANNKGQDPASWQKYIMPHHDGRGKARSLKTLLRSLVVRHQIEDIEADVRLPPLYNRVMYLQPSWHDKLSINIFILGLTINAITSERVDEDYMFHPKNRRQLNTLINNLRQAGFYWTGITPEQVAKSLDVSRAYLDERKEKASGSYETDRLLLERAIAMGELILASAPWRSFADLHEMGLFVENFPEQARGSWSLVSTHQSDLLLTGATQLAKAQKWIDSHLYALDVLSGLADVGTSTMQKLWQAAQREENSRRSENVAPDVQQQSSPRSKLTSNAPRIPRLTNERTLSRAKAPQKLKKARSFSFTPGEVHEGPASLKPALKSALKKSADDSVELLPPDSPLSRTKIYGTASAKLSYLLDRVTALHHEEKILIFYEGDHIAWYIAQALDLVDIRYLIYTKSLPLARQAAYVATFNKAETFRVLLMNVHQAAHGLHIASASRVFFVNPVWQPNVEAQAIKRAHRIGQTRPVYVETLVLKDTLEDQMLQRRKRMTAQEHQKAERSLLDDDIMSGIIQEAQMIPLGDEEIHDVREQVARLQIPQRIFARGGRGEGDVDDPDADLIFPTDLPTTKKRKEIPKRRSAPEIIESAPVSPLSSRPVPLNRNSAPSIRLGFEGLEADREQSAVPGPSAWMHNSHALHARNPSQGQAPTGRLASVDHEGADMLSKSTSSTASRLLTALSPSQASHLADSRTGILKKRVGFALDAHDPTDPEPRSLFGNGDLVKTSSRSLEDGEVRASILDESAVDLGKKVRPYGYIQEQQEQRRVPATSSSGQATGIPVTQAISSNESGNSAKRKVNFDLEGA